MILCVDPGSKKAGAAVYETTGLLRGAWLAEGMNWIETADAVCAYVCAIRISEVVVERMQAYPQMPIPIEDLITLSLMAGRVTGYFPWAKTVEYYPREWKGQVPKDIMIERIKAKATKDEKKRIRLPKGKKKQADIWDAVGIGQWHLRSVRREGIDGA
jgi:hypothetical protein